MASLLKDSSVYKAVKRVKAHVQVPWSQAGCATYPLAMADAMVRMFVIWSDDITMNMVISYSKNISIKTRLSAE